MIRHAARALRDQAVGRAAIAGLTLLSYLPERLLLLVARAWGVIGPKVQSARARRGAINLARVYTFRDGAAPSAQTVARGVQQLFEHHLRFYIESARAPRHARSIIATRVALEDELAVAAAFTPSAGSAIFLAAHFGAIELPGSILADRTGRTPIAPMEEIANPVLQAWMLRVRGAGLGLRIIPAKGAAQVMSSELEAGGIVGMVADRNIVGAGVPVSLFGFSARLPISPALLAVESGARLYVAAVIREPRGRYTGYLREVQIPEDGDRMARTRVALAGISRAFEELILKAPEQWWTLFYP
ncbi:MAG: lysophospholipid acyltransferase family protein, partial [Candidatus Limnocylindrus sp.]